MKKIMSTMLLLIYCTQSYAELVEVKMIVNTVSDKKQKDIKRWEKSGLLHTGNLLNKRIKNIKGFIDKDTGDVKIQFDYPNLEWSLGPMAFPFLIRFADVNGNVLNSTTTQDFVPKGIYHRTKPGTFGRAYLDARPDFKQEKAAFIKEKGNNLEFTINVRDAAFTKVIEIGFVTTTKTRTHDAVREFLPEKVFIKDWSSEKKFKK